MRLGKGELDPGGQAIWDARIIFIEELNRAQPEVIHNLKTDILPLYNRLSGYKPINWSDLNSLKDDFNEIIPELLEMKKAMISWAEKNNISEDWILEIAYENILFWASYPDYKGWYYPPFVCAGVDINKFSYKWEPDQKSRAETKKLLNEASEQYLNQVENKALSEGWEYTPEKREKDHFVWLAQYQIKGMNYQEIADEHELITGKVKGDDAIRKGIQESAKQIGLRLRRKEKDRK